METLDGNIVDTRWFQGRLADRRLSQRQLAKRMGLDPAAVSLMLRGKRKMSAAEAAEIAQLLGVSVEEVLLHAGSAPTVPIGHSQAKEMQPKEVRSVAPATASVDVLEIPVPMSDGTLAKLLLPRVMTPQDAQRIAALVQALATPT